MRHFPTVYDMCARFRVPVLPQPGSGRSSSLDNDDDPTWVGSPVISEVGWARTRGGKDYIAVEHPRGRTSDFIDGYVMHELAHILAGEYSTEDDEMGALIVEHTLIRCLTPTMRSLHIREYEGYGFNWEEEDPWHPDHRMLVQRGVIGQFEALPQTKAWRVGSATLAKSWRQ